VTLTDHNLLNFIFYPTAQAYQGRYLITATWTPQKNINLSLQELWYNIMTWSKLHPNIPHLINQRTKTPSPLFLMMLLEVTIFILMNLTKADIKVQVVCGTQKIWARYHWLQCAQCKC
jgi:hypothetical protein